AVEVTDSEIRGRVRRAKRVADRVQRAVPAVERVAGALHVDVVVDDGGAAVRWVRRPAGHAPLIEIGAAEAEEGVPTDVDVITGEAAHPLVGVAGPGAVHVDVAADRRAEAPVLRIDLCAAEDEVVGGDVARRAPRIAGDG